MPSENPIKPDPSSQIVSANQASRNRTIQLPSDLRFYERKWTTTQLGLGIAYLNGWGVKRNEPEALALLKKAADQGEPKAQFLLGLSYTHGWTVAQDDTEATRWYRKAAEQGDTKAQVNLALSYARNDMVLSKYDEILKWLRRAAAQGDERARTTLSSLFPTITTRNGGRYEYAVVTSVLPDSLFIKYTDTDTGSHGLAQVRFENLSESLRQRYGYSPDKAAAYRAARAENRTRMEQEQAMRQQAQAAYNMAVAQADYEAAKQAAESSARLRQQQELEDLNSYLRDISWSLRDLNWKLVW